MCNLFSDGSGTRNQLNKVEQGFSSFFAKLLTHLMILQNFAAPLLKNHAIHVPKVWQKNEEKPCSTCLNIPIFPLPKPETWVSCTQSITKYNPYLPIEVLLDLFKVKEYFAINIFGSDDSNNFLDIAKILTHPSEQATARRPSLSWNLESVTSSFFKDGHHFM